MGSAARQRRERVLELLYESGHVEVGALSQKLGTSEATIRRDLRLLAGGHPVSLVYGGATLLRRVDYSFRSKSMRNTDAKKIIGRMAADLVEDSDTIFVDAGTTCFEMAPYLKRKRGVTVVVNSARLAIELDSPNLNVVFVGGTYRPDRMDTVGPLSSNNIGMLRGYKAFVGSDGLSMDFGMTAGDIETAEVNRLAIQNALETTLLVDASKFERPALYKIADVSAVTRIITEKPVSPEWSEFLASHKVQVVYPDIAEGRSKGRHGA
jgi:DeoR/GlpR family transcriptional regulator of sugar metabolism